MNAPLQKPLLIFDGDCNFCRRWILRWKQMTGDKIEYAPYQEVGSRFPEIPTDNFTAAVHLVEPDGKITRGAEAVFRSLSIGAGKKWMLFLYEKLPFFKQASEWFYRLVANHRIAFSRITRLLWGDRLEPPTYYIFSWLFIRLVGLVYFIAFTSLAVQVEGLIGSQGILPAEGFLKAVEEQFGSKPFHILPTFFWWNASDAFINFVCIGGIILSLLLMVGFSPIPILVTLWASYLSLCIISREFLSFQWDILLLEVGFLAIFIAPNQILPRFSRTHPPSGLFLWFVRWLLFRLMFQSGLVKILSGDLAWKNLTALNVHYETQPLPTWVGWYLHQLPEWFHKFSVMGMFAIELLVPFLIFMPRRAKLVAFVPLVGLQILIALSGNYNFFNFLTIILALSLLDDGYLGRLFSPALKDKFCTLTPSLKRPVTSKPLSYLLTFTSSVRMAIIVCVSTIILLTSSIVLAGTFWRKKPIPKEFLFVLRSISPFRTVNSYGLFAVMTTDRPEIIVEGSQDGTNWIAYEFKWKPGDPTLRPSFVAPHQPRLDWQMWFAALSNYQNNRWFIQFLARLLQGSPTVLSLLEKNPFPDEPPRFVRALVYDYEFTDIQSKNLKNEWWKRKVRSFYCPVLSREEPKE